MLENGRLMCLNQVLFASKPIHNLLSCQLRWFITQQALITGMIPVLPNLSKTMMRRILMDVDNNIS